MSPAPAPTAGVAWVPVVEGPTPTTPISQQIQDQVARVLGTIPPGKSTIAAVTVATGSGFNLAFAHKVDDQWKVAAWVGKSGWDQPISGGASLTFVK